MMTFTVPLLQKDFGLSHGQLGSLFSTATIMAGCAQPLCGRAMDQFGGRLCISLLQLAIAASLFVFATWQRPESRPLLQVEVILIFFVLRLLCLGAGELFPNALVQQWFERQRGRAVGMVYICQWLGGALFGTLVAAMVAKHGWRLAALLGAVLNLLCAAVSLLFLRSPPIEHEFKEVSEVVPIRFWVHFLFTGFFSLTMGGSDFYMVEMVAEASGTEVSVPWHVFTPLAIVSSLSLVATGELMDAYSHKSWLPTALLALAGVCAGISTLQLIMMSSPFLAVCYGVLRGISVGIFHSLLQAGLFYSAQGVSPSEIGSILGYNQLCNLVGTGSANFWYGISREVSGSFKLSLYVSSIPTLLLGLLFAHQALEVKAHGD